MSKIFPSIFLLLIIASFCAEKISFDVLLDRIKKSNTKKLISVAGADHEEVLAVVRKVKDMSIADSILVGPEKAIKEIAKNHNIRIDDFKIIDRTGDREISRTAVKLVHDKEANMFMKGSVQSKDYLQALLDKEIGLRTGRPLSVVTAMDAKKLHKTLFLTDGAVMIEPTLEDKANLIRNAVDVARACGVDVPKVAPIAAVEVVNPKMKETLDAKKLSEMNENGEIENCIVDGPLSVDLAIDPEAAKLKKTGTRKITGDADILLFPQIEAGNIAYKTFVHTTEMICGNILVGPSAPCIFSSRSDNEQVKLNSVILGAAFSDYLIALDKERKGNKEH